MVYFIQSGLDGPIKIGVAEDPRRRVLLMQVGNPEQLRLLATAPGGVNEERQLHRRFLHLHIRGEWFTASQELLNFVTNQDTSTASRDTITTKKTQKKFGHLPGTEPGAVPPRALRGVRPRSTNLLTPSEIIRRVRSEARRLARLGLDATGRTDYVQRAIESVALSVRMTEQELRRLVPPPFYMPSD